MTVIQDFSIITLIAEASFIVKVVLAILLIASITSWNYIFSKLFAIRKARSQTEIFERDFWSGGNLVELYQQAVANHRASRDKTGALERIFEAGMNEYHKVKAANKTNLDATAMLDGARRAMRASYQREMDLLESHLSFLASVGSVSPYIGLLGTVWGIMNSFRGLINMQQATLAAVAPGIAEALIATAIGLFAAIPAVLAYNRFSHDIDRLAIRFETFIEEFSNILQRQSR
ncbi:MAG: protein TolQ [Undibacterium sp.]|nr:protein TolQ [Undibacterium sp.]